eukprot:TRINITY_DN14601_c0_g1_i1.p1 TRINITY_DN14601_c0_g1~~TRINITY_DN14601_c0_g1_i1.p1  ORF type:complete len:407 (+),score=59.59 TRINITY_DN14601_c0_g1_i1:153-1223(+)
MRKVIDRTFAIWFLFGVIAGVLSWVTALCKFGIPWGLKCPKKVSSWLGAFGGSAINFIGLYAVGLRVMFPRDEDSSGDEPSAYVIGRDLWLFTVSVLLCQSFVFYIAIHRKHVEMIDTGPANQVHGMHGHFAAQLLLHYGKLFDTTQYRVPSEVQRVIGDGEMERVAERINTAYQKVGLAPIMMSIFVVALVFTTVFLWKHVSHAEKRGFDEVDTLVPLGLLASFFIAHALFCRKIDKYLKTINSQPKMIRRNLAYVLWRTPVTHSYSLWLVFRNPEAHALTARAGVRWWEYYAATKPQFRLATRLLIMINHRRFAQLSTSWIPADLILDILSFIAEGNTEKIVNAKKRWVRPVLL